MIDSPFTIKITYDPIRLTGRLERRGEARNSIWDRLRVRAIDDQLDASVTDATIELAWPKVLGILRDFGSRQQQQTLNFRFAPEGEAASLIRRFADEVRIARAAKPMNLTTFTASLDKKQPPKALGLPLQALWWDAKGDWNKAHECAQQEEDSSPGQWVHAYLHRKEGDPSNAAYWYKRCGRKPSKESLEEEWRSIARSLLET